MKKILILMLCMTLLVSFASAELFQFDNVKSYDSVKQEITITNTFGLGGDIAKIKLDTPLEVVVPMGYQKVAEFTINSYDDNYNNPLEKIDFYNKADLTKTIDRIYDYKVWTQKESVVNDYKKTCIADSKNGTEICTNAISGTHIEYYYDWENLDTAKLIKGEYKISIWTDVYYGDKVEWIPNYYGIKIDEWASFVQSSGTKTYQDIGGVNYTTMTFTSNGYFNYSGGVLNVSLLIIAGGGSGGNQTGGGGGGAGGLIYLNSVNVTTGNYLIIIGAGGDKDIGGNGSNSSFNNLIAVGGGAGGVSPNWLHPKGTYGGSGGGTNFERADFGGSGVTGQGYKGGDTGGIAAPYSGSGGGGAGGAGVDGGAGAKGGAGNYSNIYNGTTLCYAGGGGGGGQGGVAVGGCNGGNGGNTANAPQDGIPNTGGGGGGAVGVTYFTGGNGGSGIIIIRYLTSDVDIITAPSVTLISPDNNYNTSNTRVQFNSTVYNYFYQEVQNVTLYIDGTLNETDISGINGSYSFSKYLSEGKHNWSILAYNNDSYSTQSATINFYIDITAPSFIVYNPIATNYITTLPKNITLNVSVTDSHLANCFYYTNENATNMSFVCNNLAYINFATAGNKTIFVFANDSVFNINATQINFLINLYSHVVNYTTPVIEGENTRIFFNLTATDIRGASANVSYDGVNYTMTLDKVNATNVYFSKNLTIPLVSANKNNYILVYYLLDSNPDNSSNYTQLVYNIPSLVVSDSCSDKAIKFELKDETNLTALNGTFQYNFAYGTPNNNTFSRVYGSVNGSVFYVCINSSVSNNWSLGDGQIFYNSPSYVDRRYYLFSGTALTNTTQNITLYDLLTADQTSFKLEVEDNSLNPYANKYTALIRWYPDLNQYNVVDMGYTDEEGSTIIHSKAEDVDYRIGVYELDGSLIYLASPIRMVCLLTPCTYTLKISPSEVDYTSFLNVDYSLTFNKTTNIWTFTFTDTTQKTTDMNLTIYRMTGTSVYAICTNTITAYTGAITCNTSGYTGELKAVALRSASPPVQIAQKIVSVGTKGFTSSFGLWISLLLAIPIIFIFAFMTPVGAVIGGVIALIPALYFGAVSWVIVGGIAVLTGIVMHFLKRI